MKKNRESPDCDICKTKKYLSPFQSGVTTWEHPGKFNFVKCTNCGLVFQSPRASFKDLINYYPSKTYWGSDITIEKRGNDWRELREKSYGTLYQGIFEKKIKGKILDIGSGLGLFLSKFKENGWEVIGTDISKDVGKYSKKLYGVDVLIGDFVKMKFKEKYYDVVSMNGVLEHVYNPSNTLRKIRKVLKDDGVLVVVVPNIESLGYFIHKKEWIAFQPGRHVYHFSPATIRKIMEDNGFKIDKLSHNFWVSNNYLLFENIKYRFSSKFEKRKSGGAKLGSADKVLVKSPFSLTKEIEKILAYIYAYFGSLIEPLISKGELIIVYAKKA